MQNYIHDIKEKAKENTFFRQVLTTGEHTQIVVMSILPGEDIGEETHPDNDQVLYFIDGTGKAILDGESLVFEKNDIFLIKAGTKHNFINTGSDDLKIITAYSPPHHPDGTVHKTKADAQKETY